MKSVPMEKVLRCREVTGQACAFVATGRTMKGILALTVTPELVEPVKQMVWEE